MKSIHWSLYELQLKELIVPFMDENIKWMEIA